MGDKKAARSVDVRGQICPYPIIKTREELKNLASGEILEVITDNEPSAMETIPRLCTQKNYGLERVEDNGFWRCFITKS